MSNVILLILLALKARIMKSVAIFGATGMTGVCVVKAALDKGLKVRALLRDTSKLPEEFDGRIAVVRGDALNIEDVKLTLEGQDASIVVLGTRNDLGPTTTMSEALKNIIAVMQLLHINVLSVCLSLFLFYEKEKVPSVYREVTADHRRMLRSLQSSDLLWVAVNAAHITDQPSSGYTTRQGENTQYTSVSKYDLAKFMVDSLTMPELFQKAVGIGSYPRR